jgi:murein DD-endopeptidase MepM/ murein hydrolase activator NlpD
MRARRFVAVTSAALTLTLGGTVLTSAQANDPHSQQSQVQQQIAATKDALENSSARLRQAAVALVRVRAELPAARSAYAQARGRLDAARQQLTAIRDHIGVLRDVQVRTKHRIDVTASQMSQTQDVIDQIARQTYQDSGMAELSVVLDAESPSEFVERVMNNEIVTSHEGEIIGQLLAAQAALVGHEQELQTTQIGLDQAKRQARAEVDRIAQVTAKAKAARDKLLTLASVRRGALQVARQEKAHELARLQQLRATNRRLATLIARTASSGSGQIPSGRLLWPVDGYPITAGVGWRVHPVYGYRSCHTGTDIGAPTGTPAHAAAAGVVVWVQPDNGGPYGNNILIDHGNGLSTFYAHLSTFLVHQGEHVSVGQTIALTGDSGWSTGPHLHFEVHINGVPYDPMGWFGAPMRSESQFCP